MTRNKQWDNILIKLEECKNDTEYVYQSHPDIPMIEIDIALEKLSIIYEKLLSLKLNSAINEENGFFSKNSSLIAKIVKESVFEDKKEKMEVLHKEIIIKEEKKLEEPVLNKIEEKTKKNTEKEVKAENLPFVEEKKSEKEIVNSESKTELNKSKSSKTIAESLNTETASTIGEMMASMYKKKDIATLQQLKPIKDLKQAISINDKIMFIKEIFANDVDKYNATLTEINSCQNLDEALKILEQKLVINSENPVMQQMLELVYRRYI